MSQPDIPRALRGRVQPILTIEEVRRRIRYDHALNPPKQRVTADEFDQLTYDAIARNAAHTSRAAVMASVRKRYEVIAS